MRVNASPRAALAIALLALVVGGAAWAQTPPDPGTWVRTVGTVNDPALGATLRAMLGEVVVSWQPGTSEEDRTAIRTELAASTFRTIPHTDIETIIVEPGREPEVIASLMGRPEVREVCCNFLKELAQALPRFEPDDTLWTSSQQRLHDLTRSPEAWALFPPDPESTSPDPFVGNTPRAIIAVIDTGVDWEHEDLTDNIWENEAEANGVAGVDDDGNGYVDDIRGWDFADGDNDPKPRLSDPANADPSIAHGTHVAGIAAAVGNNGKGVAGQTHHALIMPCKIGGDDGSFGALDAVLAGERYAFENGADIANMSYGGPGQVAAEFDNMIEGFNAGPVPGKNDDRNGIVWVASLGNAASSVSGEYPVGAETDENEVIGVSAVQSDGTMTEYTNWSQVPHYADLAAPGGSYSENLLYTSTWLYIPGEANFPLYGPMAGTSMSSPHVAGIAAMIRSVDGALPAADVRDILLDNSNHDLLYQKNPGLGQGDQLGRGIVDAYASVSAASTFPPRLSVISPEDGARVATSTPTIDVSARKAGSRAPEITRVTVRVSPIVGSVPTNADAVWLDVINNETLADGPDGLDDRDGSTYPTGGLFTLRVDDPLGIGSSGTARHVVELEVQDTRQAVDAVPAVGHLETSFRLTAVGVGSGRRMVSVPYILVQGTNLSHARPATVFGQAFGAAGQAQIARWNPSGGDVRDPGRYVRSDLDGVTDPYIGVIQPGKGYWLDLPVGTPRLIIEGDQAPQGMYLVRDAAYDDTSSTADWLARGWHQIGNPFPFTVSLSGFLVESSSGELMPIAEAVQQGICRGAIYGYLDGQYVPSVIPQAALEPFEGYWFRTLERCKLWAVPAQTTAASRSTTARASGLTWSFDIAATCGRSTATATLASAPRASDGFDGAYDLELPPPLDDTVVLTLGDARGTNGGLMRDVRGDIKSGAEWTLVARAAANQEVRLDWGDLRSLPRDYSVSITDKRTGTTLSMRQEPGYAFRTSSEAETRFFTVSVKKIEPGTAFRISIDEAVTARGLAQVSFRLTQDADVDCIVLNSAGRVVRTVLTSQRMAAGVRSVAWDGRSDGGSALPAGEYRIELRARNNQGEVARGTVSISR